MDTKQHGMCGRRPSTSFNQLFTRLSHMLSSCACTLHSGHDCGIDVSRTVYAGRTRAHDHTCIHAPCAQPPSRRQLNKVESGRPQTGSVRDGEDLLAVRQREDLLSELNLYEEGI